MPSSVYPLWKVGKIESCSCPLSNSYGHPMTTTSCWRLFPTKQVFWHFNNSLIGTIPKILGFPIGIDMLLVHKFLVWKAQSLKTMFIRISPNIQTEPKIDIDGTIHANHRNSMSNCLFSWGPYFWIPRLSFLEKDFPIFTLPKAWTWHCLLPSDECVLIVPAWYFVSCNFHVQVTYKTHLNRQYWWNDG